MNERFKFRWWNGTAKQFEYFDFVNPKSFSSYMSEFIEQSTGLKDKNGKLVFENDIVDILFEDGTIYKGLVVWRNYEFIFITKYHNMVFGKEYCSLMANYESITLVGNIHQDSHLLGGK